MVDTTQQLPRRDTRGLYIVRPAIYLPPEENERSLPYMLVGIALVGFSAGLVGALAWIALRTLYRILTGA